MLKQNRVNKNNRQCSCRINTEINNTLRREARQTASMDKVEPGPMKKDLVLSLQLLMNTVRGGDDCRRLTRKSASSLNDVVGPAAVDDRLHANSNRAVKAENRGA